MYYVYVIRNEHGRFYVGSTSDLKRRLKQHNDGLNVSTKGSKWRVIYYEAYTSAKAIHKRERALKHHGKAYQALMKRILEDLE